ncbi:uncharacterized protein LOC131886883 isoform X2 [Tigriopus californicus]|uniref:uncharacterized protein LOC131886883 isoform X2 n=1 Tax=Tigriopus californicus TaxID=6832 RepID=UPI0027DA567F|nr:uncharacterized protein LOC131886883 isoform X2 [Tigriopus californicus]
MPTLRLAGCDPKSSAEPHTYQNHQNRDGSSSSLDGSWHPSRFRSRTHPYPEIKNDTANENPEDDESKESETFKLWAEGPNFDTNMPQDVLALESKTAYLSCRVFDRGNKTISWIRHQDLHILTVGRYTYTADLRYQSIYNPEHDEWILQIKYVQKRDSGRYECQISTQPVRSFFVQLRVVDSLPNRHFQQNDGGHLPALDASRTSYGYTNTEGVPKARILGDSDVFMDVGSILNLTCVVEKTHEKPAFMLWYHGDKTIDYTSPRGGISVLTSSSSQATSTLIITSVGKSDNGKYSCQPANADLASVTVHILDGEHHAAIHTNSALSSLRPAFSVCQVSIPNLVTFPPFVLLIVFQLGMLRVTIGWIALTTSSINTVTPTRTS